MKLSRVDVGVWKSKDGKYVFRRHESDPFPKRWFVYNADEEDFPLNEGQGHVTLAEAVRFADKLVEK